MPNKSSVLEKEKRFFLEARETEDKGAGDGVSDDVSNTPFTFRTAN
jgi:hypothetical protein